MRYFNIFPFGKVEVRREKGEVRRAKLEERQGKRSALTPHFSLLTFSSLLPFFFLTPRF
jgi:hypothetical protein